MLADEIGQVQEWLQCWVLPCCMHQEGSSPGIIFYFNKFIEICSCVVQMFPTQWVRSVWKHALQRRVSSNYRRIFRSGSGTFICRAALARMAVNKVLEFVCSIRISLAKQTKKKHDTWPDNWVAYVKCSQSAHLVRPAVFPLAWANSRRLGNWTKFHMHTTFVHACKNLTRMKQYYRSVLLYLCITKGN